MIVLDTNVVSEPLKPRAEPNVITWLNRQSPETLYLTATSLAELLLGVEMLPNGKRKSAFRRELTALVDHLFGSQILPFDQLAAVAYAEIIRCTRQKGRAVLMADGQIAAIAKAHGFAVATRDEAPFLAAGVPVVNPWKEL